MKMLAFNSFILKDSLKKIIKNFTVVFYSKKVKLIKKVKVQSEKAQAKHFVDFKKVRLTGGRGGSGCSSLLSVWCKEFAGPDGGDGGNGGHIIFQADDKVTSLSKVYPIYHGKEGGRGMGDYRAGFNAEHTIIKVPLGTFFRDEVGNIKADLQKPNDFFIGARGGAGGKGNYFFLSNENRAPSTYEKGGMGETKSFYAELRIKSDVGLIGFPNAGKSSLLRCLTRAKPQIGTYPFTTLFPHIGVMQFSDYEQVAVADIPGLIEGASSNRGLGFSFLRHVEQCRSLVYVLDATYADTIAQYEALKRELNAYQKELAHKPHVVVANKMDLAMSADNYQQLLRDMEGSQIAVLPLSAKQHLHIESLVKCIRSMYDSVNEHPPLQRLL